MNIIVTNCNWDYSLLRVNFQNWLSILSRFDSNILKLLGIPGRIFVPPVTHFFTSKWFNFFLQWMMTRKYTPLYIYTHICIHINNIFFIIDDYILRITNKHQFTWAPNIFLIDMFIAYFSINIKLNSWRNHSF